MYCKLVLPLGIRDFDVFGDGMFSFWDNGIDHEPGTVSVLPPPGSHKTGTKICPRMSNFDIIEVPRKILQLNLGFEHFLTIGCRKI